jgi:homoserine kinase type II
MTGRARLSADHPVFRDVLERMGVEAQRIRAVGGEDSSEASANWHVWPVEGERCVLRRYHSRATPEDLAYEHAVLHRLAALGWTVPEPLRPLVRQDSRWYCLTRFVPGRARRSETAPQRRQRGADLARLHLALRPLAARLGQRPGWQVQHAGTTVHSDVDWHAGVKALSSVEPELAEWAAVAAESVTAELAAVGAAELPVTVIHGDFAEWNVHYQGARLVGVVDFGLTHLDSRPYELAIARTYRAPEARDGYREELARQGWPLSELEEAAIEPIHRAFRIDMVAWELDGGLRSGRFDTDMIVRQLRRSGCARPGS